MMAPAAFGRVRYCRFAHAETAPAKPMHNKGSKETNSEGFSAHPEPSRRSAAHVRRHPASWGRLCEVLDRILAVVRSGIEPKRAGFAQSLSVALSFPIVHDRTRLLSSGSKG